MTTASPSARQRSAHARRARQAPVPRRVLLGAIASFGLTATAALATLSQPVAPPAWPAAGAPMPEPTGQVLLTVRGMIERTNGPGEALLDRALLEALPRSGFSTSTVWTEGVAHYEGVLLADLLAALGARGTRIAASAIDGYSVTIPLDELHDDGPILAFMRDGRPMPVRDRGPLWVIYPFDDNPAYRNDTTFTRSIWQLLLIEVGE
jgi:hypothetical protein